MFLPKEFQINIKGMKGTGNFPDVFPCSGCYGRNPWWNGGVSVWSIRENQRPCPAPAQLPQYTIIISMLCVFFAHIQQVLLYMEIRQSALRDFWRVNCAEDGSAVHNIVNRKATSSYREPLEILKCTTVHICSFWAGRAFTIYRLTPPPALCSVFKTGKSKKKREKILQTDHLS